MSTCRILVIGDPHSHPRYDHDRFEVAGAYARDQRVDEVVCMGDWFDFTSLCKGAKAKEKEGLRVEEEVAAGHEALRRFMAPFSGVRGARRPGFYLCEGNHDARPEEAASDAPHLLDAIARDRYRPFVRAGWHVEPFKQSLFLHGLLFCHYMAGGVMGRPVGGSTPEALCRSLLAKGHQNAVVGHDHRFGHASQPTWDGGRVHAFNAGCWVHPDYTEGWCKQTEPMWDRGLLEIVVDTESESVQGYSWKSMGLLL